ncbi:putative protein NSP-INTERACTING KINASE 3-like isoform X1 [Capsicum annuum]|nr:putative protein NSP-INTERACTING KINASE 3-like isoform X1 [Capsicum annuum]
MDLTIQNLNPNDHLYKLKQNPSNHLYKLPWHMYSLELEKLDLFNCIFQVTVQLHGFPIETLNLDRFIDYSKLETVALGANNYQQDKVLNLTYLLNNWSEVSHLRLDCYYLKCFASGIEAERIPTCLNNLRVLSLFYFNFSDEDQILSLLRMLRNCLNFEDLLLFMPTLKERGGMELVDVNHFEGLAYMTQGLQLNKLKILEIENFYGSITELVFVRFILASAPLLQKTILRVDEIQCRRIIRKITTDSQVHDAGMNMAATSIAMMSRTNALQSMAPAEKPKNSQVFTSRGGSRKYISTSQLFVFKGSHLRKLRRCLRKPLKKSDL